MRRTKEDAELTRQAVMKAGIRVFLERGVARATMDDIGRTAGVTRGAVSWHFQNKINLLFALTERVRLLGEEVLAKLKTYDGPASLKQLAHLLADTLAAMEADPDIRPLLTVLLLRCEYTQEMLPLTERQQLSDRALKVELQRIFLEAQSAGALSPSWEPLRAAAILHALLTGLTYNWVQDERFRLGVDGGNAVRAFLGSVGSASSPAT